MCEDSDLHVEREREREREREEGENTLQIKFLQKLTICASYSHHSLKANLPGQIPPAKNVYNIHIYMYNDDKIFLLITHLKSFSNFSLGTCLL